MFLIEPVDCEHPEECRQAVGRPGRFAVVCVRCGLVTPCKFQGEQT